MRFPKKDRILRANPHKRIEMLSSLSAKQNRSQPQAAYTHEAAPLANMLKFCGVVAEAALQRGGTGDDLNQLASDDRLSGPVVRESQLLNHLSCKRKMVRSKCTSLQI